jgi:GNAT superfamily N-acetyltransferase
MSLYADYLSERTNDFVIETSTGFVTYRFLDDQNACFISDMFVVASERRHGIGSDLARQVVESAKRQGCTSLLCTVFTNAKGWTTSQKAIVAYGFNPISAEGPMIVFKKEI